MMISKDDKCIFVKTSYANGQYQLDVYEKRPPKAQRAAPDLSAYVTREELEKSMDPARYVGCAPHQVDRFLAETVQPILDRYQEDLGVKAEINV